MKKNISIIQNDPQDIFLNDKDKERKCVYSVLPFI